MKKMRACSLLFLLFAGCLCNRAAAGSTFDSLYAQSDAVVSGHVIHHRADPVPDIQGKFYYEVDFVIFMLCAEPARYPELLKVISPGDTLRGVAYFTTSFTDTMRKDGWYFLPLVRDSSQSCGWRLTSAEYSSEVFSNDAMDRHTGQVNYIFSEYGVTEQKFTSHGRWGYTTFTTLDGTVREQQKYTFSRNGSVEIRTKYSANGKKKYRTRQKSSFAQHGVKYVTWTLRDNGRVRLHRQKTMIID